MKELKERIGIYGGTFDPIHYGHLIVSEDIREKFKLNKIVFIPAGMPPHKKSLNIADVEHRFNMTDSAVKSNAFFEVSRIEIDREGFTYTVDTLDMLKERYGDNTDLFFIIGADIIFDLLTWKQPKKLFEICNFVAVLRPGYDTQVFEKQIEYLRTEHCAKIHVLEAPMIEISSTLIREKISKSNSIKYLLPEDVESYIYKNKLYIEGGQI